MRNENVMEREKEAVRIFADLHKPYHKTDYTYSVIASRFNISLRTAKRYVSNGKKNNF